MADDAESCRQTARKSLGRRCEAMSSLRQIDFLFAKLAPESEVEYFGGSPAERRVVIGSAGARVASVELQYLGTSESFLSVRTEREIPGSFEFRSRHSPVRPAENEQAASLFRTLLGIHEDIDTGPSLLVTDLQRIQLGSTGTFEGWGCRRSEVSLAVIYAEPGRIVLRSSFDLTSVRLQYSESDEVMPR
jgi:hypothetical protein